jgi:membrane protein implicated in regulation of membrane protease activity
LIRLVRITGMLMIAAGIVVAGLWSIKPLRMVWPWLTKLPLPIQIGVAVAAAGLLLLVGTLIWERLEEREHDQSLRDQDD